MPQLKIVSGAVDTILLPNSGVTVTMRKVATGRDKAEAWQACVSEDVDPRKNRARFMCHVAAAMVIAWDATAPDENGEPKPIPVSAQTLAGIKDEADYITLVGAAAERMLTREDDPEKEGPFERSSTPSSPGTN